MLFLIFWLAAVATAAPPRVGHFLSVAYTAPGGEPGKVLVRDPSTGQAVQIALTPLEPTSNSYRGEAEAPWASAPAEVYLLNKSYDTDTLEMITQRITRGELSRKPFVANPGANGRTEIEIFDTREATLKALEIRRTTFARTRGAIVGTLVVQSDSDILLAVNDAPDQGEPLRFGDSRLRVSGRADYRALMTSRHGAGGRLDIDLTNSAKAASAPADQYTFSLSLPYVYLRTDYRLSARPGYKTIFMDPTSTGSKAAILDAYFIEIDEDVRFNPVWRGEFDLDYRRETSHLQSSVGMNQLDANRISVRTVQGFGLGPGNIINVSLGVVMNQAKGTNERYQRTEEGLSFARKWSMAGAEVGVNLFSLSFTKADPVRKDSNFKAFADFTYKIRDWVSLGLGASWTRNRSTDLLDVYSKTDVHTSATFNEVF